MDAKTKHTPVFPSKIKQLGEGTLGLFVIGEGEENEYTTGVPAELARRWNCHEDMLEALKRAHHLISILPPCVDFDEARADGMSLKKSYDLLFNDLDTAISKAEKG
jgi:hypothetical protein